MAYVELVERPIKKEETPEEKKLDSTNTNNPIDVTPIEETKKPAQKAEAKKPAAKKAETKKPAAKKAETKKPAAKKAETKKPAAKKA